MRKLIFTLFLLMPVFLLSQTARIKIDVDRQISQIDPKIYGVFMEPIRNSLDALYNPDSPLADENGVMKNYIEAVRELKITQMRWPGGNYVSGYNWQDGIGPKDQRPVRKELAWGVLDKNQVGTDEWIKISRSLGVENVICINLGTGTLDDARYWVEYCNGEKGTYYADLRSKYGNEQSYNVKYWGLGNEIDGSWQMGHKNAEDYSKFAKEAAKLMKLTDNSISLIACGPSAFNFNNADWLKWNRTVLYELYDQIDFISIHNYWNPSDDYNIFMGQRALDMEQKITIPAAQIKEVRTRYEVAKPIYLVVDEWAPLGWNFLASLAVAQHFNSFIRHADIVKMANYTMLTSLLSFDREKKISFKSPTFYIFKLFSNNCLGVSLDVFVDCEKFNATDFYKDIPCLDVTSSYDRETKTIVINVVNRHKDNAIITDIISCSGNFTGKASISLVNVTDYMAPLSYDKQEQYAPVVKETGVKGNKMTYSFPAHSFTQISVKIE